MYNYDELSIYRGRDIQISQSIIVHPPTLDEVEQFGEQRYFGAIHTLTSVGADLKWQLYDAGFDYMTVKDYDLFVHVISQLLSSKKNQLSKMTSTELRKLSSEEIENYIYNPMSLILKNIDFADYEPCKYKGTEEIILYNKKQDVVIDKSIYISLVKIIREIHGLKRNNEIPANEATKMDMIEDARDEYLASKGQPYKSMLKPLISTMINMQGFGYNHNTVWDMKINAFFDSVKRHGKIQDAQLLLNGAYSGFVSLKGINKERLNCFGRLD